MELRYLLSGCCEPWGRRQSLRLGQSRSDNPCVRCASFSEDVRVSCMPGDLFERAPEDPAQIHWTVGRINSGCGLRYVARLKKKNDLGPLYAER